MRPQSLISKLFQDDFNMGILNKQQGVLKKRVDFPNPETQKALKNLIETLKNTFDLPQGESYEAIAEDAIGQAIQIPFAISNIPLHESIYSRALSICQEWSGDEEYEEDVESEVSETAKEDAYQAIEGINFTGSEKQINWARDIAHKSADDIAKTWKNKHFNLPTSARWWIENRENIPGALNKL